MVLRMSVKSGECQDSLEVTLGAQRMGREVPWIMWNQSCTKGWGGIGWINRNISSHKQRCSEPAWDGYRVIGTSKKRMLNENWPERNAGLVWGTSMKNMCPICSESDTRAWHGYFGLLNVFSQHAARWRIVWKETSLASQRPMTISVV